MRLRLRGEANGCGTGGASGDGGRGGAGFDFGAPPGGFGKGAAGRGFTRAASLGSLGFAANVVGFAVDISGGGVGFRGEVGRARGGEGGRALVSSLESMDDRCARLLLFVIVEGVGGGIGLGMRGEGREEDAPTPDCSLAFREANAKAEGRGFLLCVAVLESIDVAGRAAGRFIKTTFGTSKTLGVVVTGAAEVAKVVGAELVLLMTGRGFGLGRGGGTHRGSTEPEADEKECGGVCS
jgi:hypothetical protein